MLAPLANNPQPWRDAPEIGEGGGSTVRFTPWRGASWSIVAASAEACGNGGSVARISPVQVVPDVGTPLFGVLGPAKTTRDDNTSRRRRRSRPQCPQQREDGLHGCNGRLMRLVVVGTSCHSWQARQARRHAGSRFSVGVGECSRAMAPNDAAIRVGQKQKRGLVTPGL